MLHDILSWFLHVILIWYYDIKFYRFTIWCVIMMIPVYLDTCTSSNDLLRQNPLTKHITPRKINMEPENTPLEKENHLPIIFRFYVSLRGCSSSWTSVMIYPKMPTVFRDNQVLKQIILQSVPEKGPITDIVVQGGFPVIQLYMELYI